ncbi:MAG: hypothetical protein LUD81_10950 [Clostridiales bacterium]|nr:hypothetical protein [Clostridiales bacterium]
MDNSYKNAICEIKKDLNKLERKSGVGFIFAIVIGVTLLTLIVVYLVLKFKSSAEVEFYDEYPDEDGADFPFSDEDVEDEEEEEEAEEEI